LRQAGRGRRAHGFLRPDLSVENSPLLGEVVNTAQSALLRVSQNAHCRVWSARHAEAALVNVWSINQGLVRL
jgi:hypothetical protein